LFNSLGDSTFARNQCPRLSALKWRIQFAIFLLVLARLLALPLRNLQLQRQERLPGIALALPSRNLVSLALNFATAVIIGLLASLLLFVVREENAGQVVIVGHG